MRSAPLWNRSALVAIAFGLLPATSALAEYRNGARFDPGREMNARAEGAPAELDRVTGFIGQWDVEIVRPQSEGEAIKTTGEAEITFMNRGHHHSPPL